MTTSHWPARLAWALVGLTVLACVGHSMLFLRSSEPLTSESGLSASRPGRADHRAAGVAPRHGGGPRPGEARFPAALRRSVLPHLERLPDQLAAAATGTADARTYNKGWI